jgi:hypothetical protein
MKITDIRTRVVEWHGPTVPPQPHFCTNPMDVLQLPHDAMAGFRFHGWLIVEVFTDAGHVGIGEAALSPRLTKACIDLYLKPLLIGADPFSCAPTPDWRWNSTAHSICRIRSRTDAIGARIACSRSMTISYYGSSPKTSERSWTRCSMPFSECSVAGDRHRFRLSSHPRRQT